MVFGRIRILASTTANIQPILMTTNDITIDQCTVLLVQKNLEIAGKNTSPSEWQLLLRHGSTINHPEKIRQLSIKGYNFHYHCSI